VKYCRHNFEAGAQMAAAAQLSLQMSIPLKRLHPRDQANARILFEFTIVLFWCSRNLNTES
jgi:hypothetical protein